MLSYEKIAFEDSIKICESIDLKMFVESNMSSIERFANKIKVDKREVLHQVRLHAPQFKVREYNNDLLIDKIFPILSDLFRDYPRNYNEYLEQSGVLKLKEYEERDDFIITKLHKNPIIALAKVNDGKYILKKNNGEVIVVANLVIAEVTYDMGRFIENKLHYLHSFRDDAILRLGLFIEGCSYPICYMSFSRIDRLDKIKALRKSLNTQVDTKDIIELSRVYGCGELPKNTISYLISMAKDYLADYRYLITAVNINLGFLGTSMLSAGFVPYALRPVKYSYNINGHYVTSRKQICNTIVAQDKMPPNILYVKELDNLNGIKKQYCSIVLIKSKKLIKVTSAIEAEISEIRNKLEKVWNTKTRYHRTDVSTDYKISKGQCGVSSLHLALKLKRRGYDVLFCEGDFKYPKKDEMSISNHCWIVIRNYRNRKKNLVVDITADQNGYSQKIVFNYEEELEGQGLKYISKVEKDPDEVNVENLLRRLNYLEFKLNQITKVDKK